MAGLQPASQMLYTAYGQTLICDNFLKLLFSLGYYSNYGTTVENRVSWGTLSGYVPWKKFSEYIFI